MHFIALLAARATGSVLTRVVEAAGPDWRPYLELAGIDVDGLRRRDPATELHAEPASAS